MTAVDRSCNEIDSAHCFEPSWLAAHSEAVTHEYLDLFQVLHERFGDRKVRFVLSNWWLLIFY